MCVPLWGVGGDECQTGTWVVVYLLIWFSESLMGCLGAGPHTHSTGLSPGVSQQLGGAICPSSSLFAISLPLSSTLAPRGHPLHRELVLYLSYFPCVCPHSRSSGGNRRKREWVTPVLWKNSSSQQRGRVPCGPSLPQLSLTTLPLPPPIAWGAGCERMVKRRKKNSPPMLKAP